MAKNLKIFILGICFLLGLTHFSFASTNCIIENSSNTEVSTFTLDTSPSGSTTSFYVQLQQTGVWDSCGYCDSAGTCACSTTQAVTVTSTSSAGVTDSITANLAVIGSVINGVNKYRNSTAFNLGLATSSSPSTSDTTLSLVIDAGTQISFAFTCGGTTDTATATVTAVPTTGAVILSNSSALSSNTATFTPNTDKAYVQVTDYDQNKNAYTAETVSVTLSAASTGDSIAVTLTETGANTGVFQYTTGVSVVTTGDTSSTLLVTSTGGASEITATYTDGTQSSGTNAIASDFSLTASSPQTAGTAFALTITARDANGSTVTTYSGTATLTTNYVSPASGLYTISPTSTSSFTSGVATVNVTYADAGTITITATDTNSKTGTSNQILVLPANFLVESTGGLSQVVGKAFNLKVTARNSSNNTTPNYNRDVNLTASNVTPTGTSPTISPTSITGSNFSSGAKTVSMTYNKWGTAKITATDSGYSTVTGSTSSAINFYPNSFSIDVAAPPASRSKFYIDETFDITVKPLDYSGNTITNYAGTVTFPTVSDVDMPDDYAFLSADSGQHAFSLSCDKEKTFKLEVSDKSYTTATGESSDVDVIYGKIKVNDASGPIGTISTAVEIVDKKGKVIDSDDSTTFVVTLSESKKNSSATAATADLTVSAGKGTVSVTDSELESVTVTPDSTPKLAIESGIVTFSETAVGGGGAQRIGSGARILFWRELRSDEAK
ncbi:MAG: hypothetical protein Q8L26_01655 [Candidatus Omnitrophota bacterium]|nr:hypothetical protein [Candidatus Omnitrophota bacterium]